MSRLVVADPSGQILDHPSLGLAGRLGREIVEAPAEDLLRVPEGTVRSDVFHARRVLRTKLRVYGPETEA